MNRRNFLLVVFCIVAPSILSVNQASAVESVSEKTQGTVKFGPNDGGGKTPGKNEPIDLIKPGTADEIISIDGGQGTATPGALRFSFIPSFDFGEVAISSKTTKYEAKMLTAKDKDKKEFLIPHFLQVINEQGNHQPFKVYVRTNGFLGFNEEGIEDNGEDLQNSRIVLKQSSVFNTRAVNENSDWLDGVFNLYKESSEDQKKFVINETDKEILSSKDGKKTDVSASSMVFDSNYTVKRSYAENSNNSSVYLEIPYGDFTDVSKTYEAIVEWSLSNAP